MRWNEPAPGERESRERSWPIVRAAWEARIPSPAASRVVRLGPLVAIAAGLVVVAAALSPPGMAVLGSIRDAVRGEKNAAPALYRLPTQGRLLVESARGAWIVQRDGSKRLLSGYHDVSWSPHGLYLAAIRGHELRALEPNGNVHWSLARPGQLATPRWSFEGYRIAYRAGDELRVVNGDGTGDRVLATRVASVAPSWRPATHVVAYVDATGDVRIVDADTKRLLRRIHPSSRPEAVDWSPDGGRLLVRGGHTLEFFGPGPAHLVPLGPGAAPVKAAAFSPTGQSIAFIQEVPVKQGRRSFLWVSPRLRPDATRARRVFAGAGSFANVAWSPDGRWLLLDWRSANQWVFMRSTLAGIRATSNITGAFGPDAAIAGWCCP